MVPSKVILLTATPKMHATVFTLNLMRNGDYFFHLRVDFPHGKHEVSLSMYEASIILSLGCSCPKSLPQQ